MKTDKYHSFAQCILEYVTKNQQLFENVVLLKTIEEEVHKKLMDFNEVIADLVKEVKSGKRFSFDKVMDAAMTKGYYHRFKDFLVFFRFLFELKGGTMSIHFKSKGTVWLLELGAIMKKMIRATMEQYRVMYNFIHLKPETSDVVESQNTLKLKHIPKHDREHLILAHTFTKKHDAHKNHGYIFLTFDKVLGERKHNYNTTFGKLTLLHYQRFCSIYGIELPTTSELLVGSLSPPKKDVTSSL